MLNSIEYTHYSHTGEFSSALDNIWYDVPTNRLWVQFHSGQIAGYRGVDEETYRELRDASSVGYYYVQNIKPYFTGISVEQISQFVKRTAEEKCEDVAVAKPVYTVSVEVAGPIKLVVPAESIEEAAKYVFNLFAESPEVVNITIKSVVRN
jgi:hypothetical protein